MKRSLIGHTRKELALSLPEALGLEKNLPKFSKIGPKTEIKSQIIIRTEPVIGLLGWAGLQLSPE